MHGAMQRSWPRWCVAESCRNRLALCGWSEAAAERAVAVAVRPEDPSDAQPLPTTVQTSSVRCLGLLQLVPGHSPFIHGLTPVLERWLADGDPVSSVESDLPQLGPSLSPMDSPMWDLGPGLSPESVIGSSQAIGAHVPVPDLLLWSPH